MLEGYPHQSIHADHIGIARFGGKESEGYQAVSGQLGVWADGFVSVKN